MWVVLGTGLAAALALLLSGIPFNRQFDLQIVSVAWKLLDGVQNGHFLDALLELQKYPLFGSYLVAIVNGVVAAGLFALGTVDTMAELRAYIMESGAAFTVGSRFLILLLMIVSCVMLMKISRRLWPKQDPLSAVVLLVSCVLFLTFSSAVRPHPFVLFFTLLTFLCSLRLAEKHTPLRALCAFGAASMTLASLQTGIFAFVFPVMAMLVEGDSIRWKKILSPSLFAWTAGALVLAIIMGYPYLIVEALRGGHVGYSLGITEVEIYHSDPWGYMQVLYLIVGEPILLLCLVISLLRGTISRRSHPMVLSILLYFIAFYGIVCLKDYISQTRVLLPTLPLLVLLAVPGFEALWKPVKLATLLLIIAIHVQLFALAIRPDTFEQARRFLLTRPGTISTEVPWLFLGIPPTRASLDKPSGAIEQYIAALPADLPGARPYVSGAQWKMSDVYIGYSWNTPPAFPKQWSVCKTIRAGDFDWVLFLWNDVPLSFFRFFQTESLGMNLTIHCRAK